MAADAPNPTQPSAAEQNKEQAHDLDPNILQKYLFVNSDKIYQEIIANSKLQPTLDPSSKILTKATLQQNSSGRLLTPKQAASLLSRQRELMSLNMVPSFESAKELFSDPKEQNWLINSGYTISHNIILSKNGGRYIFNIDELNRLANSSVDGSGNVLPKFLIHKVVITNQSKDAFTAKSNFKVSLHIVFSYLEDLKEEFLVKNLASGAPPEKFSLINLLYPRYKKNAPVTQANKGKEIRTGDGIVLNQVLNFVDNKYFKETKSALGGLTELHKNYHLTFQKHTINIFKSNDPFFKAYDNELIIDYVAYEAETKPSSAKDDNTPTNNENIYSLLFKQRATNSIGPTSTKTGNTFQAFTTLLNDYNTLIKKIEDSIKCVNKYKIPSEDVGLGVPPSNRKEFLDAATKKVEELQKQIDGLKQSINVNLMRYIVNNLDVYRLDVDRRTLVRYHQADRWNEFWDTFSSYVAPAAGTAAGAGFVATSTGLIVATGGSALLVAAGAAAIGVAATALAAGVSAQFAEGDIFSNSVFALRDGFLAHTISRTISSGRSEKAGVAAKSNYFEQFAELRVSEKTFSESAREGLASEAERYKNMSAGEIAANVAAGPFGAVNAVSNAADAINQASDIEQDKRKESERADSASIDEGIKLKQKKELDITEENIDQPINIEFILFGQIVDLLPKSDAYTIFGGRTLILDPSLNSVYLNYYYTPISMLKFLDFLNNKIVKRGDQEYSSEVFLRDIVENLLKDAVKGNNVGSALLREFVPTHINMNVALTDNTDNNTDNFVNSCEQNILVDSDYNNMKKNFIKAKNIIPRAGGLKLKKVYTVASEEEIKYFNFYGAYRNWRFLNRPPNIPNSSDVFQEFILENYAMPCIRTKANDLYGSILSTKNLTFSRKDNPNLVTGQTLDNSSLLRLPYTVTGQFKPYIFFFVDVASFMFVAPPDKRDGSMDSQDTFGYGGLYLVKGSSFEYNFQLLGTDNAPLFPNEKSKCELQGQMISYGDGIVPGVKENTSITAQANSQELCTDPVPVSPTT